MEKQKAFGWAIAWAIFLGGSAGGIFLVSYILAVLFRVRGPLVQSGLLLGPLLAIVCGAFFMLDLSHKIKMPRLLGDLSRLSSSWITRGVLTLTIFILFGLAHTLPFLPWNALPINSIFGIISVAAALMLVIYTGFLLGVVKSIPFWNNPLLPVLFVVSGLGSGTAILLLAGAASGSAPAAAVVTRVLAQAEIGLIVLQLIMLWAYLGVSTHRDLASAESVRLVRAPAALIMVYGLALPMALLISSLALGDTGAAAFMELAAGALELAGAFFLRSSILNAGVYLRLEAP